MRVRFDEKYDHTYPGGSMQKYRPGWEGTVKREVGRAAVKAGKATELPGATPLDERTEPEETLQGNLSADLADPPALTPNLHVDETQNSE